MNIVEILNVQGGGIRVMQTARTFGLRESIICTIKDNENNIRAYTGVQHCMNLVGLALKF